MARPDDTAGDGERDAPARPVSWLVVDEGWTVVGVDGDELGTVSEVLGDAEADIFNGLAVVSGLLGGTTRYVPAEVVGTIREGTVELTISAKALDDLQHEVDPPGG